MDGSPLFHGHLLHDALEDASRGGFRCIAAFPRCFSLRLGAVLVGCGLSQWRGYQGPALWRAGVVVQDADQLLKWNRGALVWLVAVGIAAVLGAFGAGYVGPFLRICRGFLRERRQP